MRFHRINLYTNKRDELARFYSETMEMPVEHNGEEELILHIGKTDIHFLRSNANHHYHFAFNIPPQLLEDSRQWLARRVDLLKDDKTGESLIHFSTWNAHSMYFLDPAGNVVEFIARHYLSATDDPHFSGNSLMEVSEIGLPVSKVGEAFSALHRFFKMSRYSGNYENFCAAGNQEGLFILVPSNRTWYPSQIPSTPFPLQMVASHHQRTGKVAFDGQTIKVSQTTR